MTPSPQEIGALLRLLDDDTPGIQQRIAERLAATGGDLSEYLAHGEITLNPRQAFLLTEILQPLRRETLASEWIAPSNYAAGLNDDWETFEAMLRMVSDFLHDGLTVRQSLGDAIDLLAEEADSAGVQSEHALAQFLFAKSLLRLAAASQFCPAIYDLSWGIAHGLGNRLTLCLIYALVARRLDFDVAILRHQEAFFPRYHHHGHSEIIDCAMRGESIEKISSLDSVRNRILVCRNSCLGELMLDFLAELKREYDRLARTEDSELIERLIRSLCPSNGYLS